ncbi:BrnT family toxin [Rugamonas aquatica]|uniref:BrnT family toxin n=1 Tax=Rugamonas aquatica TaxID=2743357 RepID=A0A6A7N995_9BURK|nr:BrnT family toxin [Rugamonas aquatica]
MRFEWDARKANANLRQHGVSFEEACTVFDDRREKLQFDGAHSAIEDRYRLFGHSTAGRMLVVVHCYRGGEAIRVISAYKASRTERADY